MTKAAILVNAGFAQCDKPDQQGRVNRLQAEPVLCIKRSKDSWFVSQTRYILSVDLGGGGPKVALVSERGDVVDAVKRATPLHFLPAGGVEQDPQVWWSTVSDGAKTLLERKLVPPEDIVAIAVATQWSVTVPVDRDGEPLMRAVHWMDKRGARYSQALMDGLIKISGFEIRKLIRWMTLTGGAPVPTGADVLSHILFLKNECPEVYQRTYKLLEPCDYLTFKLTGRMATSYSTVFPYLLADTRDCSKIRYSERLMADAGVAPEKLPDLFPVDTVLGNLLPVVAQDWGLSPDVKVMIGMGDSHAAILGSGAVGLGQPHLCIGTSSWMTCLIDRRRMDLFHEITSMPSAVPGQYMLAAEQGAAGKLLEMFVERWFGPSSGASREDVDSRYAQLLSDASAVSPGSGGVKFLPWLNGAGPPAGEGAMRGGFLNLSLSSTPPEAIRAVMEGVGFNLRWLAIYVEKLIGRPFSELNFIGGGARSPVWCQILADVLGRTIRQVADPDYAIVRGAAMAALMGLRLIRLEEIPGKVQIEREFVPDASHCREYDRLFAEFLRSYRTTRPLFRRWSAR